MNGTWKLKRNLDESFKSQVLAEIKGIVGANSPVERAIEDEEDIPFDGSINDITKLIEFVRKNNLMEDFLNNVLPQNGLKDMGDFYQEPQHISLIPKIYKELKALC